MTADPLVLGIDGGGTKTVALLATAASPEVILARGTAGPSNPRAVGFERAIAAIDAAVDAALQAWQHKNTGGTPVPPDARPGQRPRSSPEANTGGTPVPPGGPVPSILSACLGLAGAGRASERREMERWAKGRQLARHFIQVHDALPVLAAGARDLCGVALIAGTGSLAFGRNRQGETARCGGWGYLFGDEGSGYAVGIAALRAVAHAADGRGPATLLTDDILKRFGIAQPANLVEAVYHPTCDRPAIGSLAEHVFSAARCGDAVATSIVEQAAGDLAGMVATTARRLHFGADHFSLSLTGGLALAGHDLLTPRIEAGLSAQGIAAPLITMVSEPAMGAVRLAALAVTDKDLLSTLAPGVSDG